MIDHDALTSIAAVPAYHARVRPNALVMRFEGRETNWAQFEARTNQAANGLAALGVKPGERICYVGKNTDWYFEAWFAATKIGAVMCPIGWRLAPPEVAFIIEDSKAPVVIVGEEFVEHVEKVAALLSFRPKVIALGANDRGWPIYADWRDQQSNAPPAHVVDRQDVCIQLYTSGTTGNPKGVMLTHYNFTFLRKTMDDANLTWNRWSAEDVSLVAMPISHIGGSGWGFQSFYFGALAVIAREFDPNAVLDFIERDRISKLFLVPAAMQIVLRNPRAREVDYSRLKTILYGASPIPLELLKEGIAVFKCGFAQQYGMTETTGTVVALPPEDHDVAGAPRMRSAGKALPGMEIRVIADDGSTMPLGEVGEIAVKGPNNMKGYWNLPEATAKTLGADGWLRTGDAGYMDADGYVYIHDRVKDMIISGGENIYPAEVENAIFGHPAVAEVAVIGVPDEKWGEAVKAIVALKPGAEGDPASIIAWARERIAAFKTPKSVDFIDALPRNASGKILRRQLREPYWKGMTRAVN